jgi:hypothetical protein
MGSVIVHVTDHVPFPHHACMLFRACQVACVHRPYALVDSLPLNNNIAVDRGTVHFVCMHACTSAVGPTACALRHAPVHGAHVWQIRQCVSETVQH